MVVLWSENALEVSLKTGEQRHSELLSKITTFLLHPVKTDHNIRELSFRGTADNI